MRLYFYYFIINHVFFTCMQFLYFYYETTLLNSFPTVSKSSNGSLLNKNLKGNFKNKTILCAHIFLNWFLFKTNRGPLLASTEQFVSWHACYFFGSCYFTEQCNDLFVDRVTCNLGRNTGDTRSRLPFIKGIFLFKFNDSTLSRFEVGFSHFR